jgi:excisionase family DNA binding protein
MNTSSLQTTTNLSDPDAAVHRKLISKKELAKELSVSPRTIDNWVRQKRIPVHRFSSRFIRFNPSKVFVALDKFEIREVGRKVE